MCDVLVCNNVLRLLFVATVLFCPYRNEARSAHLYSIKYQDSVQLQSGSPIVSNSVTLVNEHRSNISMGVTIVLPKFWRTVGKIDRDELATFFLKPGEK